MIVDISEYEAMAIKRAAERTFGDDAETLSGILKKVALSFMRRSTEQRGDYIKPAPWDDDPTWERRKIVD